jgi:LysR family glycine cleavage system transcriptional activator
MRTPSLDALRIFVVAARHLSFTHAADELHLTQSAVSHRIRGLEEELGLALFERLTRRLELTTEGRALARKVELAISKIDRSIIELGEHDDGPLKMALPPSVASHWLIPRLPRIRRRHPELDVQVIASSRLVDLRAERIDLAIHFGPLPNLGYAATRLMGDCVIPVCTPDLLRRHEAVDDIDTLLSLPLLDEPGSGDDHSGIGWRAWLDYHGRPDAVCRAGQQFSDAGILIDAAVLGLGVALAQVSLVVDRLASGALVCPLRLAVPTGFAYHLLCLPEAIDKPKVALFRSLLMAEAAATEASILSVDQALTTPAQDNYELAPAA